MSRNVGFIGAGNMAQAIIAGIVDRGGVSPELVRISEPDQSQRERVTQRFGVAAAASNAELVAWADCVVLAVKPQVVPQALAACADGFGTNKLLISLCAGITTRALEEILGATAHVVRAMPNTPALVGEGATAVAPGAAATDADVTYAQQLFSSVGSCVRIPETYIDAVTGLSGSGPAFIMLTIEAMADGGVRAGLPRAIALELATQTVLGAAKLVRETGDHPGVLKDRVTSPAGTTIEGVSVLERGGLRGVLADAVVAAARRATELGSD